MKYILLLFIVINLIDALPFKNCPTETPPNGRRNCYPWSGMTQSSCEARGCVYCVADNAPHCYFNDEVCPSEIVENERIDCHPEPNANRVDCLKRQCLWCKTNTPGIPFCFRDEKISLGGEVCPQNIEERERIDCYPSESSNKEKCLSRGCFWCQSQVPNTPWCFMPQSHGYKQVSIEDTMKGFKVTLKRKNTPTWFGKDLNDVAIDVEMHENHRLRIKIYDPSKSRYEVPLNIPSPNRKAENPLYKLQFVQEPAFGFKVIRNSTDEVLFDSSMGGLKIEDQFFQISAKLPTSNIYGFGETEHKTLRHDIMGWKTWGMFARDQPVTGINLYSVHPFFTALDKTNAMFGCLFLNSNAQEVTMTPAPGLIYRTIGGVLDMYFFLGPSPENVIAQYTEAIGRPFMPPYWSLGFHLSRYGYNSLDNMKAAINRMRRYNIPHDVQHGDIDVLYKKLDFTYDRTRYAGLPDYIKQLRGEGTRYVQIQDPCISFGEPAGTYPTYDRGMAADVWVKESDKTTNAIGKVWPEDNVYFPDYSKTSARNWWINECVEFNKIVHFDGIWIDMNEPANFLTGSVKGCNDNEINRPLFKTINAGQVLADKTVCLDYETALGNQYNTHSLFGWAEAEPSLECIIQANPGKRGLVISRSTFPGAGKYTTHWLGDNHANWQNLAYSIIGSLEFNMFGIPYVGADICGFIGNTNQELCARWHQLGAFYSFARNHNAIDAIDQDPGVWLAVASIAKEVFSVRYTLLPYLYTLFYDANTKGGTVMRPVFHEFVNDEVTHNIDKQFMWGNALLITPVLEQGATSVRGYFPDSKWYNWYTGAAISTRKDYATLQAPLNYIPLHLRGGHIIPTQKPENSTVFSRLNPFGLIVTIGDDEEESTGHLFWDDGDSLRTIENNDYLLVDFKFTDNTLTSTIRNDNFDTEDLHWDHIKIMGYNTDPVRISVNNQPHSDFTFNNDKLLQINNLVLNIDESFEITIEF